MRKMLCPYCKGVFRVRERQLNWNFRFRCPYCKKFNYGSVEASEDNTLIGITKEALELLDKAINTNRRKGMLKQSARCAIDHCEITKPDSLNHRFILLDCKGCNAKNFCLRIKRVMEEGLNTLD